MKTPKLPTSIFLLVCLTAIGARADYPAEVLADAPLAYYRFEEPFGTALIADSSGNGLEIANFGLAGTTLQGEEGAIGSAILFNGDGSFLTPLTLDPSIGDFTIEALVNSSQLDVEAVIVSNQDGVSGPGRSNLIIQAASGGPRSFVGGVGSNGTIPTEVGSWYHVVLTYDQSAVAGGVEPTIRFYVNGELAGTSLAVAEPATGGWVIGSHKGQAAQFFSGLLDEVAIYGTRLDDPDGDGDTTDSRIGAHFKEFAAENDVLLGFETDSEFLAGGESATLSWTVTPALTALTLDDGSGPVDVLASTIDCEGSSVVSPVTTTTYTLIGTSPVGTEELELTITVDAPPTIDSFTSSQTEVTVGSSVDLSWAVTNAVTVEIDNGVGMVDPVGGTAPLVINGDTTFTLTATNASDSVTAQVTITTVAEVVPNLVAHWTFDEGIGETAADSVNSPAQDGTLTNGPVWVTGTNPVGAAGVEFFDTDDIVQTNYAGITGTNPRTVTMWMRGEPQVDAPGMTMLSYGGSNGNGSRYSFRLNNNAGNGILGAVRLEVAGGYIIGSTPLLDSTWHHVAVTNAENTDINEASIYVDGVLEAITGSLDEPINSGGTQLLAIGGSNHSAAYNFTGGIDDVRIYDGVLNAEQILAVFEGRGGIPLVITDIVVQPNGFVDITWSGPPGDYAVDYSFDMSAGSWIELTDSATIAQGETTGTVTDNFISPLQNPATIFYRVKVPE